MRVTGEVAFVGWLSSYQGVYFQRDSDLKNIEKTGVCGREVFNEQDRVFKRHLDSMGSVATDFAQVDEYLRIQSGINLGDQLYP